MLNRYKYFYTTKKEEANTGAHSQLFTTGGIGVCVCGVGGGGATLAVISLLLLVLVHAVAILLRMP